MRRLAKILLLVAGLVALIPVGVYAYLSFIDVGEFRDEIAQVVKESTGRDLVIAGDVTLRVFPAPKLVVERVSLSNAEWGRRPSLMSVDRLEAEIALLPLLSRTITVERVVLLQPYILLERNTRGDSNWILWADAPENGSASAAGLVLDVDVSNVEIRNGRISYLRHGSKHPAVLEARELRLRSKGWLKPMDVWFKGHFNGRPLKITGEAGSLATLLRNEPFAVNLALSSRRARASLEGGIKRPMELRGVSARLKLESPDLGRLFHGSLPPSVARVPLAGEARLRDKAGRYTLDEIAVSLGSSDLTGSISVEGVRGRTLIRADLESRLLSLDEILPDAKEQKSKPGRRLIPASPLPAAALRAVDAHVHYNASRLALRGVEFDRLAADLTLDGGRLVVTPSSGLYGGTLDGELILDASTRAPRLEASAEGTKVGFGALISALEGSDYMSGGTGTLVIKLAGEGHTPRHIAASMDGRLVAHMGPGRINNSALENLGADVMMQLARAINTADATSGFTEVQCSVIRFDVKNGIAKSDRGLAAETRRMNIIGSGRVDFRSEEIDFALRTEPREGVGLSANALTNLVRVGGTLAEPAPEVDPVAALKTGASVGAAVVTSGLSLLAQGLFNRVVADRTPCRTALGIKKKTAAPPQPSRPASRASRAGDQPGGGPGRSSDSESLGEVLKGIGEKLKGLFGN